MACVFADQAAPATKVATGKPLIPVYVLDDKTPTHRKMGRVALVAPPVACKPDAGLREPGSRLVRGRSDAMLAALAEEIGAAEVHALHRAP